MVEVRVLLSHITSLDEIKGLLTMETWLMLGWQDDHLKWNPEEFSGVRKLHVAEKQIWKPDLAMTGSRGGQAFPWVGINVEVNSTGFVTWNCAATVDIPCGNFDYSLYPKDIQTCSMAMDPLSSDIKTIDLKLLNGDYNLDNHKQRNPHWHLVEVKGIKADSVGDDPDEVPYAYIQFNITFQRKNIPYTALFCLQNCVARVLILCMFWLSAPIWKFLLGCTALIVLTFVAVGISVTLPTAAASPFALFEVNTATAICISAIIVEIIVTCMSGCTVRIPAWLEGCLTSTLCFWVTPCNPSLNKTTVGDKDEMVENSRGSAETKTWMLIATFIDRVSFVVFLVLLLAI